MERTPRNLGVIGAAVAAATAKPDAIDPATLPPAAAPFQFAWDKFNAMAVPPELGGVGARLIRHAFYAGGRVARQTMIEGLSEMASDDPELAARGEERLASLEIEIERHFSEAMRQAANTSRILKP